MILHGVVPVLVGKRVSALLSRLPDTPTIGAEIGVFKGVMSREILSRRSNVRLLLVDAWEGGTDCYCDPVGAGDFHGTLNNETQDRFAETARKNTEFAKDRVEIIRKRSVDAAREVCDGSLDFVFIDADHSYEGCRNDIMAWAPKLKEGGLLSGHDYENENFPLWGVKRAVTEFAETTGRQVELGDEMTWFIRC